MGMVVETREETPVDDTMQVDLTEDEREILAAVDHSVHLVAISNAQQAMVAGVDWRRVVHNAVDPADYRPITNPAEKHDFLLHLQRHSHPAGHLDRDVLSLGP